MTDFHDFEEQAVNEARRAGKSSDHFRYLRDALRQVGIGSLVRFNANGTLFAELKNKCGIGVPLPPPPKYPYYSRSIIELAVEVALERFMRLQVLQGGWDAKKGSSLRTYFVGAVLRAFADEYKAFYSEEVSSVEILTDDPSQHGDIAHNCVVSVDPADVAEAADLLTRLLPTGTPNDIRSMFQLTADGYSQPEIAMKLGVSAEAISSAMRRYRKRIKELHDSVDGFD